jgi:hypothetical protein
MTEPENIGTASGRDALGRWAPGPGNRGRPPGIRNKTTRAVAAILGERAEELARQAVARALDGDTAALRLCLERIAPPAKDAPVTFALPAMRTARDAAQAAGAVLEAVAGGELTPSEGAHVMALVEAFRRTLETSELEARIAALEAHHEEH